MTFLYTKLNLKSYLCSSRRKGLDLFLFVVTDILTNDSVGLAIGKAANVVEKAYNVSLENNTATLKGVVSRKNKSYQY